MHIHICRYKLMEVLVFKVWLAAPSHRSATGVLEQNECPCTETAGVTQESKISESPCISWMAGAADRCDANPGQREGEVTAYKSSLSVSRNHLNYFTLAGH